MKRILSLVLSVILLISLFSPAALAVLSEELEGAGMETVEIASASDFLSFAEQCSRDVYSQNVCFSLTADIDLSNTEFSGVPYFAGSFLGNGHSILGLSLSHDGSRVGLFRRVAEGAVIRDLTVKGSVRPGGTRAYVGGIAGINAGQILCCSFDGSVEGLECIGGIAGQNEAGARIDGCTFTGSLSGEHHVGGITGFNAGSVSESDNRGRINTEPIVPQSERHFDVALLAEDEFLDLTNIGGIVGSNDGAVGTCRNSGAVGYKNTGYNVGGIVGKSSGYVSGCENRALIQGRRDVGGIVGQLIPSVSWDISNDKLDALAGQMGSLNYLINKASQNASANIGELSAELSRMKECGSNAVSQLEHLLCICEDNDRRIIDSIHVDPDTGEVSVPHVDLSAINTCGLTSALLDLNAEAALINSLLHTTVAESTEDLGNIVRQMSGVVGAMFSLLQRSSNDSLFETNDLSAEESYDHDLGAVADCLNYGNILAENNAGGIVGTTGFEISFDMEDSLDASRFITADVSRRLFAVIRGCKSYCEVQTKGSSAGVVIGEMEMGAAVDCVGAGSAASLSGDYVGGIAGLSEGSVLGCWSRAALSGKKYVGGITGLGQNIKSCRCWTHIDSAAEYAGAVAGWAEGDVIGNLYVDGYPAGVDNVSLSGMTDPVTLKELLQFKELPDGFNDLSVRFIVDGKELTTLTVPFGGSVDILPEVGNDGDRYWKWDDFNREHIYCSMDVSGRYYSPGTTLSSGEEIPLFLVEGVFYEGQRLTAAQYPVDETEDDILAAYTLFVNDYDGALTVHMKCEEDGRLYLIGEDSDLIGTGCRRDGQYLVFTMDNGGSFVYRRAPSAADMRPWIAAGVAAAAAVIGFALIRGRKKRAKTVTAAESPVASAEETSETEPEK